MRPPGPWGLPFAWTTGTRGPRASPRLWQSSWAAIVEAIKLFPEPGLLLLSLTCHTALAALCRLSGGVCRCVWTRSPRAAGRGAAGRLEPAPTLEAPAQCLADSRSPVGLLREETSREQREQLVQSGPPGPQRRGEPQGRWPEAGSACPLPLPPSVQPPDSRLQVSAN